MTNSDLLVTNSVFENNIAQSSYDEGGGGIYFDGVNNSISIINNEFNGNIGKYGGAIQINSFMLLMNSFRMHITFLLRILRLKRLANRI